MGSILFPQPFPPVYSWSHLDSSGCFDFCWVFCWPFYDLSCHVHMIYILLNHIVGPFLSASLFGFFFGLFSRAYYHLNQWFLTPPDKALIFIEPMFLNNPFNNPNFNVIDNRVHLHTCTFPGDSDRKNLSAVWETCIQSLGQEDALEEGLATHSRILAWRTPQIGEPGELQSMGLQRVRHD